MKVLKVSYIAELFFAGHARGYNINSTTIFLNGKRAGFTVKERNKLKEALDTISSEIQNLSDSL